MNNSIILRFRGLDLVRDTQADHAYNKFIQVISKSIHARHNYAPYKVFRTDFLNLNFDPMFTINIVSHHAYAKLIENLSMLIAGQSNAPDKVFKYYFLNFTFDFKL